MSEEFLSVLKLKRYLSNDNKRTYTTAELSRGACGSNKFEHSMGTTKSKTSFKIVSG